MRLAFVLFLVCLGICSAQERPAGEVTDFVPLASSYCEPEAEESCTKGSVTIKGTVVLKSGYEDDEVFVHFGKCRKAQILSDGKFEFHCVPEGRFFLSASSEYVLYPDVEVTVSKNKKIDVRYVDMGRDEAIPSDQWGIQRHPIVLEPWYNVKGKTGTGEFSIWPILKSPMIISMVIMGGMAWCLPKMMENLCRLSWKIALMLIFSAPEELKEMQEQQKQTMNMDFGESITNFLSGSSAPQESSKKKKKQ